MKFDYINDVHLDFWVPFNDNQMKFEKRTTDFAHSLIPEYSSDTLVMAGDIGHFNKQNYWFLRALSGVYRNILLVFGNHDYYLTSKTQIKKYNKNSYNRTEEMKQLASDLPNVHYLEGDSLEIEGVVFGGTGMWYDFSFAKQIQQLSNNDAQSIWATQSNDFKCIRGFLTEEHFEKEKLRLSSFLPHSDVIITHVGPDWKLSPYNKEQEKHNSYYFFDGSSFLQQHIGKTWCYGHAHAEFDIQKEGWRFISHALGYPDESPFKKFQQIQI